MLILLILRDWLNTLIQVWRKEYQDRKVERLKHPRINNYYLQENNYFQVFDKKTSKTRLSKFLKSRSLLIVNDSFKNESNAVFGVFLQRLINKLLIKNFTLSGIFSFEVKV
jgi:hypothetical protein